MTTPSTSLAADPLRRTDVRPPTGPGGPARPRRERRHDLDWLRVLAVLLLLYFHTAMLFVAEWGWHIKNPETSPLLLEFNHFLSGFRMALLFLISGIGTGFALGYRSPGEYLRERGKRLLVPLVFGVFVVVPPQIYVERLVQGETFASYLDFYASVFALRPYPAGNTSWHHLWFVFYLFGYSLVALPLFLRLCGEAGDRVRAALGRAFRGPGILLPAVPLGLTLALLRPVAPGPQNVIDDAAYLLYYFLFFVFGFLIGDDGAAWDRIVDRRRTILGLALLATTAINALRWNGAAPPAAYTPESALYLSLRALNAWCWVLAILGYGRRHLSFRNRLLAYANEGVYPFYILHQTVIVVLGYYVIQVEGDVLLKFLFTSTLSLVATVALYEFAVRPYRVTRFLFGMKTRRVAPTPPAAMVRHENGGYTGEEARPAVAGKVP